MLKVDLNQAKWDAWVKKAKVTPQQFASEFCQELANEVVAATPVRTGFLRASWFPTLNSPAIGGGGAGGGNIAGVASNMKIGDVFYMVNTASYAMFVEYGTVKMAARSFVRSTVARAQGIAASVAAKLGAR